MALDLEDRLLGEKVHYYCSSSEDEGEADEDADDVAPDAAKHAPADAAEVELREAQEGRAINTGPKGVIQDWRRFKQLETERREEQGREKAGLAKKLSLTCRSQAEDEREQQKDAELLRELELELDEFDEAFLKEYQRKRIEELRKTYENLPKFGCVLTLSKDGFLDAIDKEKAGVTVMVLLYEERATGCAQLCQCFDTLAQEYLTVKFCKIKASEAKLSHQFSVKAVPAILAYKNGELVANFIQMNDELGNDFCTSDVEGFLLEHGLLPDTKECTIIRETQKDDSDDDLD